MRRRDLCPHSLHQEQDHHRAAEGDQRLGEIAVSAAEQIYTGSGRGEEKKAYVLEWLRSHGVTVDDEKLDAMIEAAVYELTQGIIPLEGVAIVEGGDTNDGD